MLYICIYIFIYIGIHFELRFFRKLARVGVEPTTRAYRAHALTTELSGRTMRCA